VDSSCTTASNIFEKRKRWRPTPNQKASQPPELAVALSGIPLIVGGTSLLLGAKPKVGAVAVLGFLAGVSPIMHDFWRNEDPTERQQNLYHFIKNAALAGGALALMGVEEPWEASVSTGAPKVAKKLRKIARDVAA
jgi:uncharacterized membrane protein YphA (DoxX/SURF4 family)